MLFDPDPDRGRYWYPPGGRIEPGETPEAAARGVEATPASAYFAGRAGAVNGLVLGFGAVRPDVARRGMERLASAIEAARRR